MKPRTGLFLLWMLFVTVCYLVHVPDFARHLPETIVLAFLLLMGSFLCLFFGNLKNRQAWAPAASGFVIALVILSALGNLPSPTLLARHIAMILLAGSILIVCAVWGRRLLTLAIRREGRPSEETDFFSSLGLGVFFLLLLTSIAGFAGLLHPRLFRVCYALAFITAARPAWNHLRVAVAALRRPVASRLGILAIAGLAQLFVFELVFALAPPVTEDALVYHLTVPARYAAAGCIFPLYEIPHSFLSALGDMSFLFSLMLGGPNIGMVMNCLLGLSALLVVRRIAAELLGEPASWFAALLMGGNFLFAHLSSIPNPDIIGIFFASLALRELLRRDGSMADGVLAAFFAGAAVAVKTTEVFFAMAVVAVLLVRAGRSGFLRASLRLGTALLLPLIPWWIRNGVATGNPFIFMLGKNADWGPLTAEVSEAVMGEWPWSGVLGLEDVLWKNLLLPWNLTMLDHGPFYDFNYMGPLFLVLLPFAFLARGRSAVMKTLLGLFLFGAVTWALLLPHSLRYGASFLPVVALLAASGAVQLLSAPILRRLALPVLAVFLVFPGPAQVARIAVKAAPVVTGEVSSSEWLDRMLPDLYRASRLIASTAPRDALVLSLPLEERSYYMERNFAYYRKNEFSRDILDPASLPRVRDRLIERGVTHLYVSNYDGFLGKPEWKAFQEAVGPLEILYESPRVMVYDLRR